MAKRFYKSGTQEIVNQIEDPYRYLAVNIFNQLFRDIRCYFYQTGTYEDRRAGKDGVKWVLTMDQDFVRWANLLDEMTIEKFHQVCLAKINEIKNEALDKKGETV